MSKVDINAYVSCVAIHHAPQHAEAAAQIMAKQWNHKASEIERNLQSMLQDSKDTLPCHLALLLNIPADHFPAQQESRLRELVKTYEAVGTIIVGHVKLMKADGRSDGACCISYSLVVDERFRGYGLGRRLTEEAENYARSLNLSYMYLSTNDKVEFYEHLGYKQCEPVSSLGSNSKRLTASQVSSLEGLFAKRLNICNPTECNTWLRKRLIDEYPMQPIFQLELVVDVIGEKLTGVLYEKELSVATSYYGVIVSIPWQQQTGPSCGISALNMVHGALPKNETAESGSHDCSPCEICTPLGCGDDNGRSEKKAVEEDSGQLTPLTLAIRSGISNDGEMFCAHNLSYVASQSLGLNLIVDDACDLKKIWKEIMNGRPVLVPYDRDLSNHGPSLAEGGQAHWAVINGVIVPTENKNRNIETSTQLEIPNNVESKLYLADAASSIKTEAYLLIEDLNLEDDIFLVCMHGMSPKPFVCTYQDLLQSNQQLYKSKSKFYMASEDLKHLRGKIIFVRE